MTVHTKGEFINMYGGAVSTSTKANTALSFGGPSSYSNKNVSIDDLQKIARSQGVNIKISNAQTKYIKDFTLKSSHAELADDGAKNKHLFSIGIPLVVNYDAKSLAKDGRIFALLDGQGFQALKKTFPSMYQVHHEGEAIVIF